MVGPQPSFPVQNNGIARLGDSVVYGLPPDLRDRGDRRGYLALASHELLGDRPAAISSIA